VWCVVRVGSSGVSSLAFSPLSQDLCGVSREEVWLCYPSTVVGDFRAARRAAKHF